jgi:hypothetical protein
LLTRGDEIVEGLRDFLRELDHSPILWRELHDLLGLGADRTGSEFTVPYIYRHELPSDLPGPNNAYLVVTAERVRIRAAPKRNAPVIATVSYHYLELPGSQSAWEPNVPPEGAEAVTIEGETYSWWKVLAPNGRIGYILEKYVRPACGGLLINFLKVGGEWKITAILTENVD